MATKIFFKLALEHWNNWRVSGIVQGKR